MQGSSNKRKPRLSKSLCATTLAFSMLACVPVGYSNDETGNAGDHVKTATPIKHVIIIVGENRSFDHIYATYVPKNRGEKVSNLLSEGIVNTDGTPGPNCARRINTRSCPPPTCLISTRDTSA